MCPSGATICYYLDRDKDVTRFQGQAFNWIGIDETAQHQHLMSGITCVLAFVLLILNPTHTRCTANPEEWAVGGQEDHIDGRTNEPFAAFDIKRKKNFVAEGHEKAGQPLFLRKFVLARLSNPT